jgi:hypothetical protein
MTVYRTLKMELVHSLNKLSSHKVSSFGEGTFCKIISSLTPKLLPLYLENKFRDEYEHT